MAGKTGSYSGNPADSDKDEVRFLTGDTKEPFDLSDQEITYAVAAFSVNTLAAAELLEGLAAEYARLATKKIGSLSVSLSDVSDKLARRAVDLRRKYLKSGNWTPYVGGLSHDEKVTDSQDTDLIQPHTRTGQDDNPGGYDSSDPLDDWTRR